MDNNSCESGKTKGLRFSAYCNRNLLRAVKIVSQHMQGKHLKDTLYSISRDVYVRADLAHDPGVKNLTIKRYNFDAVEQDCRATSCLDLNKGEYYGFKQKEFLRLVKSRRPDGWNQMDLLLCYWMAAKKDMFDHVRLTNGQYIYSMDVIDVQSSNYTIIGFTYLGQKYRIRMIGQRSLRLKRLRRTPKIGMKVSNQPVIEQPGPRVTSPTAEVRMEVTPDSLPKSAAAIEETNPTAGLNPKPEKRIRENFVTWENVTQEKGEPYELE